MAAFKALLHQFSFSKTLQYLLKWSHQPLGDHWFNPKPTQNWLQMFTFNIRHLLKYSPALVPQSTASEGSYSWFLLTAPFPHLQPSICSPGQGPWSAEKEREGSGAYSCIHELAQIYNDTFTYAHNSRYINTHSQTCTEQHTSCISRIWSSSPLPVC